MDAAVFFPVNLCVDRVSAVIEKLITGSGQSYQSVTQLE